MTSDVAADDGDDVIMASLLGAGSAVCITCLSVLVILAARRRQQAAGDKLVVVPVSAAQRLLAVAAGSSAPTAAGEAMIPRENSSYYAPQRPRTLYGDKWTTSHVTSMKLLITGHQHDLLYGSSASTCFV